MSNLLLYGHRESGHSYKVRLLLSIAQIPHRYETIDISSPRDQRPESFRSIAKYGEVPVLLHDGQVITQSNAILCHLAEHVGGFGAESATRMNLCRKWLFWEANRLGFSLPHLRFGSNFAPEDYSPAVLAWIEKRLETDLARLDLELSDGRTFILDDTPSIADFSIAGYMFWPEQAQVHYPEHVEAWLQRMTQLPGWAHPYDLMNA